MTPGISVIIATRNRAQMVRDVLEDLASQCRDLAAEVIVVDNGSADDTQAVLREFTKRLCLRTIIEPTPGKSRALNRALDLAEGDVVAFTDDDVRLAACWTSEYLRAIRAYPHATAFCGPIVPEFPSKTPQWLRENRFSAPAFGRFEPGIREGRLGADLPHGANFAVCRQFLGRKRFRLDLGPSGDGALMSEDTEFLSRLSHEGSQFVYLPRARVVHRVQEELIEFAFLFDRAFNLGRSVVIRTGAAMLLPSSDISGDPEVARFEVGAAVNWYLGQLLEVARRNALPQAERILRAIHLLGWDGSGQSLGKAAAQCLPLYQECVRSLAGRSRPAGATS